LHRGEQFGDGIAVAVAKEFGERDPGRGDRVEYGLLFGCAGQPAELRDKFPNGAGC
jgi:hypothetical protein